MCDHYPVSHYYSTLEVAQQDVLSFCLFGSARCSSFIRDSQCVLMQLVIMCVCPYFSISPFSPIFPPHSLPFFILSSLFTSPIISHYLILSLVISFDISILFKKRRTICQDCGLRLRNTNDKKVHMGRQIDTKQTDSPSNYSFFRFIFVCFMVNSTGFAMLYMIRCDEIRYDTMQYNAFSSVL